MQDLLVKYVPEFIGETVEAFECDPIHAGKQVYIKALNKAFLIGADGKCLMEVQGILQPTEAPVSAPPLVVLSGTTYRIPDNAQQVFMKKITCEDGARIQLDGLLIEG